MWNGVWRSENFELLQVASYYISLDIFRPFFLGVHLNSTKKTYCLFSKERLPSRELAYPTLGKGKENHGRIKGIIRSRFASILLNPPSFAAIRNPSSSTCNDARRFKVSKGLMFLLAPTGLGYPAWSPPETWIFNCTVWQSAFTHPTRWVSWQSPVCGVVVKD